MGGILSAFHHSRAYTLGTYRPYSLRMCIQTKYAFAELMRLGCLILSLNNTYIIKSKQYYHHHRCSCRTYEHSPPHWHPSYNRTAVSTCSIYQPWMYLPYSYEFYEIDRHHLQKATFSALHFRGWCSQSIRFLGEFRRDELFAIQRL